MHRRSDPLAIRALRLGSSEAFAFWLTLASNARDTLHPFYPYFAALPRNSPDPCSWPASQRALLQGTPLASKIQSQRALLSTEFSRIASVASQPLSFDDLLWARGIHLSRCFPRVLLDTAVAKPTSSAPRGLVLRMQQGGAVAAVPVWSHQPEGPTLQSIASSSSSTGFEESSSAPALLQSHQKRKSGKIKNCNVPVEVIAGSKDAGSDLGCMLPLYDMMEHVSSNPISWEAGSGGIRFCCGVDVSAGQALANNYGPKGNGDLLFTYGFATAENPFDSVEGIILGCAPSSDSPLDARRAALLDERGISHSKRADGALLIGPFSLVLATQKECDEDKEDDVGHNVLPPELLFALQGN